MLDKHWNLDNRSSLVTLIMCPLVLGSFMLLMASLDAMAIPKMLVSNIVFHFSILPSIRLVPSLTPPWLTQRWIGPNSLVVLLKDGIISSSLAKPHNCQPILYQTFSAITIPIPEATLPLIA